ncbi:MAG: hypothetical protein A4E73_00289 [Syntrophaceae bacterium PtaU1.Bin231]|nr:MAG: hypothetical protein A4E73_00289 [Syntrophaceae bacterium PtaU1.Bin231]
MAATNIARDPFPEEPQPSDLSDPRVRGIGERRCPRVAASVMRAQGYGRGAEEFSPAGCEDGIPAHDLHPLLRRVRDHRRTAERRLDGPGAGLRLASQSRRPLLQRGGCAESRSRRAAPEVPDEAGERRLGAAVLEAGHRRDRRQAPEDPGGVGTGRAFFLRIVEGEQRGRLSARKICSPLGNQQRRQPGAHLPFHHRGRRREHLGLRRHDELLQRHAEQQGDALSGKQRRRSAPRRHAAHPPRQRRRLEDDRRGPALHPHGGPCGYLRPTAVGHRHPVHLRAALAYLQERLGRQGIHRTAGLRHGPDPQGSGKMAARRSRKRHRRPERKGFRNRADHGEEPPRHDHLVHGHHPASYGQPHDPAVLRPAARPGQHRGLRRRRQHLPGTRQRPGRHGRGTELPHAVLLLRAGGRILEALVPRLEP